MLGNVLDQVQLRSVRIDEESRALSPRLHPHRKQPRTAAGLLDDARALDLSIQLVDVIHAETAHEGTLLRHEIGKREELQLSVASAENQPAVIPVSQFESELSVEGDRLLESSRRQVGYCTIGHVAPRIVLCALVFEWSLSPSPRTGSCG